MDLDTDEVLEPVVSVEPAAILPQLREPWPYRGRRRTDRDGARRDEIRTGQQIIPGQLREKLLVRRAPSQ